MTEAYFKDNATSGGALVHACADVRWLPCSHIDNQNDGTCTWCYPSGLRFPGLSFNCSNSGSTICSVSLGLVDVACERCQGRGRVAVDSLEAWLDAAEALGKWEMALERDGYAAHINPFNNSRSAEGLATCREAITEVVCKATKNHPEKEAGPLYLVEDNGELGSPYTRTAGDDRSGVWEKGTHVE